MPQIRPITDLRNTNEISDVCHSRREPVFITKNGYGDLVVMSIETYEEMLETVGKMSTVNGRKNDFSYVTLPLPLGGGSVTSLYFLS